MNPASQRERRRVDEPFVNHTAESVRGWNQKLLLIEYGSRCLCFRSLLTTTAMNIDVFPGVAVGLTPATRNTFSFEGLISKFRTLEARLDRARHMKPSLETTSTVRFSV